MSPIHKFSYLVFLLVLLAYNSFGQPKDNYKTKIDSLLQTTDVRPFNGVVLVTQRGKTKYSKSYGYSNFSQKIPLKLEDKFLLLSNSKQITAVLILQEVDKGNINLDAAIKNYLPELKQTWGDSVTVHNLLNNTSGIAGMDKALAFKAGTKFNYSNINYILLGRIVEFASKKTFEAQVNELFRKCGMENSFFPNSGNKSSIINGIEYLDDNSKKVITDINVPAEFVPALGIVSTANDLSKWNHKLHNGKLLKHETYKLMTTYSIKNKHAVFGEKEIGYGYGLRISDSEQITEFGHTGIVPNFGLTSLNLYYPSTKTSVIVLENQAFNNFDIAYHFETMVKAFVKRDLLRSKRAINK